MCLMGLGLSLDTGRGGCWLENEVLLFGRGRERKKVRGRGDLRKVDLEARQVGLVVPSPECWARLCRVPLKKKGRSDPDKRTPSNFEEIP